MNEELIKNTLTKAVNDALPEVVNYVVEEHIKGIRESVEDVKNELGEISTKMKFSGKSEVDEKKEQSIKEVAFFFRNLKAAGGNAAVALANTKTAYMNIATDSEGGYLVPEEFVAEVYARLGMYGFARRRCTILPNKGNTVNLQKIASNTVTAYWTDEGGTYTKSKPTVGRKVLSLKKVTALVPSTLELINDAMTDTMVYDMIITGIVKAMAKFEDTQVMTGDGTGSNLTGVLTDSSVNVVTMASTKTAFTDITYDNLIDVVYSIDEEYLTDDANIAWFMHRTVLGQLKKLKDTTGRPLLEYVFDPNYQKVVPMLLGYPVQWTSVMPKMTDTAAGKKFIAFGDLKNFYMISGEELTIEQGYASGDWEKDILSFKARQRLDGGLLFPEGIAVLKTAAS